jgi:hypothetical protein
MGRTLKLFTAVCQQPGLRELIRLALACKRLINQAMAPSSIKQITLMDLPLELVTAVCLKLDLRDLVRLAETCKRFRVGDDGMETVELPTKSPVVIALREHAFSRPELVPSTLPIGCAESWVAYLARRVRQHCCRHLRWAINTACS